MSVHKMKRRETIWFEMQPDVYGGKTARTPPPSLGRTAAVPDWYVTKDGDLSCLELYERHYSAYDYRDGRKRSQFVGPGEHIVLRTGDADAMFVWRKFIDDSGQTGVNCAVFRNEGRILSSELVRQADAVADFCWPGERHYTFVNSQAVRSTNPGFCFVAAGWRRCGMTKSGLLILERPALMAKGSGGVDG